MLKDEFCMIFEGKVPGVGKESIGAENNNVIVTYLKDENKIVVNINNDAWQMYIFEEINMIILNHNGYGRYKQSLNRRYVDDIDDLVLEIEIEEELEKYLDIDGLGKNEHKYYLEKEVN